MATQVQTKRPISEKLADLSQRAKSAEDAFAAACTESTQTVDSYIDNARATVEKFKEQVQQDAATATVRAKSDWRDIQSRIATRLDRIKASIDARKHQLAADRAEARADAAEEEATAAVADASAAVEYARFAVLYAVAARHDSDSATP
jgi:hypothetical protein